MKKYITTEPSISPFKDIDIYENLKYRNWEGF